MRAPQLSMIRRLRLVFAAGLSFRVAAVIIAAAAATEGAKDVGRMHTPMYLSPPEPYERSSVRNCA